MRRIPLLALALLLTACSADGNNFGSVPSDRDGDADTAVADVVLDTEPVDASADAVDATPDVPEASADTGPPDVAPADVPTDTIPDEPSTDIAVDTPDGAGPLEDRLRMNHVQVKGTHNSYHVRPAIPLYPSHDYTHVPLDEQLGDQGVRAFELDVHYDPRGYFTVFHVPAIDPESTCDRFTDCLELIRGWSDANQGHVPIIIWIEPKDDVDISRIAGHYDELDAEIRSVWTDRVVTPDLVQGGYTTLREAVVVGDWPTLAEVRSHVVFVMLDTGSHHEAYTYRRRTLEGRAMFVLADDLDAPYAAFVKYDDPIGDGDRIESAARSGFMVACNAGSAGTDSDADNQRAVDAGLMNGAHSIHTDFPAPVRGREFWFDTPGGVAARCNPVTSPDYCADDAFE